MWIFSGLQLLITLVLGVIGVIYFVVLGAVMSNAPHKTNEPDPIVILPFIAIIFAIIGGVFILTSIPKVIAGYGLRKEKSWAKPWTIVACIMACMNFPLGTAVGVYGLVFLFSDAGKQYFGNPSYGQLSGVSNPMSSPPPNSWQ